MFLLVLLYGGVPISYIQFIIGIIIVNTIIKTFTGLWQKKLFQYNNLIPDQTW